MDAWRRMISAQGGDPDAPMPTARETHVVTAAASGVLTGLDAMAVGLAAWRLGAGRARKEDPVQAAAGVEMLAKPGDTVTEGQDLLVLHTDEPERFERALAALDGGVVVVARRHRLRAGAAGHRPGLRLGRRSSGRPRVRACRPRGARRASRWRRTGRDR